MSVIPEKFRDIFQKKAFAHIATLMPDGSPHVTPLWCEYDGTHIWINSAKGRVKDKNMRRDARVALSLQDPDNAYRYIQIRGKVVEITEKGAEEHIDKFAKKYTGKDKYQKPSPDQVRVIYKIKPEKANTMG
jgi:PPOX class probable F420-dependent enzyme